MRRVLLLVAMLWVSPLFAGDGKLRVATFEADVTPPLGTPLCDALVVPAKLIVDPLAARGIVLLSDQKPIVLCAVDWVGVGNAGHTAFRDALAEAVGTTRDRVAVHCLHQHDAPGCDFLADDLLKPFQLNDQLFNAPFARKAIAKVAAAAKKATETARVVTHVGVGRAKVEEVASNRRVLGADGKVKAVRYSATKDAKVRAEPEGVIDPFVHLLCLWSDDTALASLTTYATHPQSHYGKGGVSCDFPGLARGLRDRATPKPLHVHFNGAGGNVTAGKYNDGDPMNRMVLADRLARGMKAAFDEQTKSPVSSQDLGWRVVSAALPLSKAYTVKDLETRLADGKLDAKERLKAARNLAWAQRCEAGDKLDLACLTLGSARVLHMPGELFVEYQLAAQKMRPGEPVLMAAYGDYGPGYIGVAEAYSQGGYETGPVSRVAPQVEAVLMAAMRELLR